MHRNGKAARPVEEPPQAAGGPLQGAEGSPQGGGSLLQGGGSLLQSGGSLLQSGGSLPQSPGAGARPSQSPSRAGRASYKAATNMAHRLLAAQMAIETALSDPALLEALAARGYGEAALKEGQALVAQARELYAVRRDRAGDKVGARRAWEAALADATTVYKAHVATARVALRGDAAAAAKLDIGARDRRQAGWLLQAQQFYLNALRNAGIVEAMERYGVTRRQLEDGQRLVESVLACHGAQQRHVATAREAVAVRDVAFQSLDPWMRDFLAIPRIALAQQPQSLQRLGIVSA